MSRPQSGSNHSRDSSALVVKVLVRGRNPKVLNAIATVSSAYVPHRRGNRRGKLRGLTAAGNDIARGEAKEKKREERRSGNEGGFRRMQPLSIDNPRPHQRRYAITAAAATANTAVATTASTVSGRCQQPAVISWLFSQSIQEFAITNLSPYLLPSYPFLSNSFSTIYAWRLNSRDSLLNYKSHHFGIISDRLWGIFSFSHDEVDLPIRASPPPSAFLFLLLYFSPLVFSAICSVILRMLKNIRTGFGFYQLSDEKLK